MHRKGTVTASERTGWNEISAGLCFESLAKWICFVCRDVLKFLRQVGYPQVQKHNVLCLFALCQLVTSVAHRELVFVDIICAKRNVSSKLLNTFNWKDSEPICCMHDAIKEVLKNTFHINIIIDKRQWNSNSCRNVQIMLFHFKNKRKKKLIC